MKTSSGRFQERFVRRAWGAGLMALVIYAIWRVGGFDLTTALESGRVVPNTHGTVDHPFHASRAASLLESIQNGTILRWMGSHQGGYPVEFYPLGAAWLDVILWAAMLGSVPILAVHKLAVGIVFVLPALAYWLLVRGDNLHPSVAFLAMAFHMAIPGFWLNGGYEELVGWGLVTNVAGASLALSSTVALARYILYRQHFYGVLAVLSISAGAVTNPRSLFGVVLATIAIAVWSLVTDTNHSIKQRVVDLIVRIGSVGVLSLFLAAPVILALLRYNDTYFFLHYQFYDPLRMFWDALEMALSPRILLLAIGGGILVFVARSAGALRVSQVLAITTALYTVFTIWVASTSNPPPLVEQLEAPRLMPFQRYLMLALAAAFLVIGLQWLTNRLSSIWREVIVAVVVLGLGLGSISMMSSREEGIPENENAMYPVSTVGDQRFTDLEDAVHLANDVRPPGTAVFVIGNDHDWWHEQLWAPGIEHGTYYYDDWLWYWHTDQPGPYDWTQGYWMPNPTDALTEDYLVQHGIGVVMVSDMWVPSGVPPKQAAADHPLLSPQGSFGAWDIYTVDLPTSIATRGDTVPADVTWSNQRIDITFADGSGPVVVRQNWFPRWQADVNGEPAAITREDSGYMSIEVPDGGAEITLHYGVTTLDWIARAMSVVGVVGVGLFATRGNRLQGKGEGSAQPEQRVADSQ